MKNNLFKVLLFCLMSSGAFGQFHFGAGVQLFDFDALGIQGKAFYEYDDTWRGVGSFTFYLDEFADFAIDLDAQYKLLDVSDNFNIAPLAGLTFFRASAFGVSDTSVGLNLGAFLDFDLDGKHLYGEPKFVILDGNSGLVLSAGIFF